MLGLPIEAESRPGRGQLFTQPCGSAPFVSQQTEDSCPQKRVKLECEAVFKVSGSWWL